MENKEDENIEKLVKKMLMDTALESPSADFTQKIMAEVLASEKSKSFNYKPIFSRRTWLIIFTGIIGLFTYVYFNSAPAISGSNTNFSIFNFDKLEKILQDFQISPLTGYVILLATIVILIQTFLLKKYFDKRFES